MTFEQRIERAIDQAEGMHFVNAPTRGVTLMRDLQGRCKSVLADASDDPLLFAYQCLDVIKQLASDVVELEKWAVAVRDATPDQIQETGAQLCR